MAINLDFTIEPPPFVTESDWATNFGLSATQLLAVYGVVCIIVLFVILRWTREWLRRGYQAGAAFQRSVLLVMLPKEAAEGGDQDKNIETVRAQIAIAESWFATLGGMKIQSGFRTWLLGRTDHFSLEIVAQQGVISFYIVVPNKLRTYVEQQLSAQYPEAQIMAVEDYRLFQPRSQVVTAYIKATKPYILPFNTYQRLQADPLNAITNSLSQVAPGDSVAIQIIARSAHRNWHRLSTAVARRLHQGEKLAAALKAERSSGILKKLFSILSFSANKKDDKTKPAAGLSPMEQELVRGIEEKTSKAGLDCNVRLIVTAGTTDAAQHYLASLTDAFSQYNFYEYGNTLKIVNVKPAKLVSDVLYRRYQSDQKILLNTEELASLYHLPTPFLETPNIRWLLAKKFGAPTNLPKDGLLLGENIYRGVTTPVYLQPRDRRRHQYIIGMTGTGKSVLMANLALQDIRQGHGVCVIDPHGSLVEDILDSIPPERIKDVVYFNPSDVDRPIGLNMLEAKLPQQQDFVIQEMISIFYKLVTDPSMIGPMFEHNMRNAMLTLMADTAHPGTIAEIPRMFTDREFQKYKVGFVTDPIVKSFWEQEMAKTSDFHKSEMLGYLISKVGRFIENSMMRNIIGQPQSGFDFREIMDGQKILLVNLAKGVTGELNSNLLGLIIVAKLQMAALSRTDIAEEQRKDFYVYIDEFQNFITDSIAIILAEARKYKLNLILAHQYLGQLTEGTSVEGKSHGNKIRDAIFGNVGTLTSFRIGVEDAEVMEKQFAPAVNAYDLMNVEKYNAYVRLLVDNQPTRAFTLKTLPPSPGSTQTAATIKQLSRQKYGRDRKEVEADILERSQLGVKAAETIAPPPLGKTL